MTTRDDPGGHVRTCELCDGSGWEATNAATYTQVMPCRCTAGQRRRDIHRRIVDANDRDTR